MNYPSVPLERDERLVAELHRLGVTHLAALSTVPPMDAIPPADLLAQLAGHPQARFRSALILLFLRQPSLAAWAPAVAAQSAPAVRNTLRLFYQAATYLQPEMETDLRAASSDVFPLPDLFSAELGVPVPGSLPVETALRALAGRHAELTGIHCNWAGTYRQHLPLFLRLLRRHAVSISA